MSKQEGDRPQVGLLNPDPVLGIRAADTLVKSGFSVYSFSTIPELRSKMTKVGATHLDSEGQLIRSLVHNETTRRHIMTDSMSKISRRSLSLVEEGDVIASMGVLFFDPGPKGYGELIRNKGIRQIDLITLSPGISGVNQAVVSGDVEGYLGLLPEIKALVGDSGRYQLISEHVGSSHAFGYLLGEVNRGDINEEELDETLNFLLTPPQSCYPHILERLVEEYKMKSST